VDFKVVIRATDPGVIKKYVEVGFGIAVLPTITVHPEEDPQLRTLRAAHLFKSSTACVIMAKGFDVPEYGQDFIRMVSGLGTRRGQRAGVRRQLTG
jgi:LysR family cys regulon transcriptional activator